eukprot:835898-Amphidinium_carterae.1
MLGLYREEPSICCRMSFKMLYHCAAVCFPCSAGQTGTHSVKSIPDVEFQLKPGLLAPTT